MTVLRTRQKHWKPTLEAVQRFGNHATRNTLELTREQVIQFMAGEDQTLGWDGDWGYLIVTHDLAGEQEPLGVGLYTYDELKSMVPKGRRREL
jgi:NOL1/NOP2/fmu family ribosome biogenesis protein